MIEDMRRALIEGLRSVSSVGAVITAQPAQLPFFVVDSDGGEVELVSACLQDLMLGDASPLTCRSYAFDLLRWHRLLWCLETGWDEATEADVATLVGWLRTARNPQKRRKAAWFGSRGIGEPQGWQAVPQSLDAHLLGGPAGPGRWLLAARLVDRRRPGGVGRPTGRRVSRRW